MSEMIKKDFKSIARVGANAGSIAPSRRGWLGGLAVMLALSVASPAIQAQPKNYPSHPIQMVVGFPPGGSNDVVARIIAPKMGEILGTSVIVVNKPGANALIGTAAVAKAEPDGYTITLGSASPLVISAYTYNNVPFDTLKDLVGISTVAATAELVAVNSTVPVKSLQELVALSQKRTVSIASSGNGGLPHLAIEVLKTASKGRIMHVPYKGAGPAINDAIGSHVDGIVVDIAGLYPHVVSGKLRPIATTDHQRSTVLPDVPTTVEQGMSELIAVNWFAVMAPAKTPKPIVDKLFDAVVKSMKAPDVIEQLKKVGIEPMIQKSPEAFSEFLKSEMVRWGAIAKASGAKAE